MRRAESHTLFPDLVLMLYSCTSVRCIEPRKAEMVHGTMATRPPSPRLLASYSLVKDVAAAFSGQINEARGSGMTKEQHTSSTSTELLSL